MYDYNIHTLREQKNAENWLKYFKMCTSLKKFLIAFGIGTALIKS
jgi:hypothetical protein